MDHLEYIQNLMIQISTQQSPENMQAINDELTKWTYSEFVVPDSIQLLSSASNEIILFHAARSLCSYIQRFRFPDEHIPKEALSNIIDFLIELVKARQTNSNSLFYRFCLVCIADISLFYNDFFPLPLIFGQLPVEISFKIVVFYLEDWPKFKKGSDTIPNTSFHVADELLSNIPLSQDWMYLFTNLVLTLSDFNCILKCIPMLYKSLEMPELYEGLINHIHDITVLQFSDYKVRILVFSIDLSKAIRLQLENNPTEKRYICMLIELWTCVLRTEDENGELFDQLAELTYNLMNEFTIVEKILLVCDKENIDIELCVNLFLALTLFCESILDDEKYMPFIVNILDFLSSCTQFGVDVVTFADGFRRLFYTNSNSVNSYFMNVQQIQPVFYQFLVELSPAYNPKSKEVSLDLIIRYCQNIEHFIAFPNCIVPFINHYMTIVPQFNEVFLKILIQTFENTPSLCAKGFYLMAVMKYPPIFNIEFVNSMMQAFPHFPFTNESENTLPYLLAFILMTLPNFPNFPNVEFQQYFNTIGQFILSSFEQILQTDEQRIIEFYDQITLLFQNLKGGIPHIIVKKFCSHLIAVINSKAKNIWLNPSDDIQSTLCIFVDTCYQLGLIEDSRVIVAWLNCISTIAPLSEHFLLLKYVYQYYQMLPNFVAKLLDEENIVLSIQTLSAIDNMEQWDPILWNIFPPQTILHFYYRVEHDLQFYVSNSYNFMMLILKSEVPVDFIEQVLKITLDKIALTGHVQGNGATVIYLISLKIGQQKVIEAFQALKLDSLIGEVVEQINNHHS